MKKILVTFLVLFTVFAFSGCKSDPSNLELDPNIPDFIANPPVSDNYIFGVGNARFANNNSNEAMRRAEHLATVNLASKIDTAIEAMVIDYTRIAGTEINQTTALSFYESVSRQLTDVHLIGVEVVKRERTKDGTWWVLVQMSKENAAQSGYRAVNEVLESEASRYAEFKAMEALKMLDAQLGR